MFSMFRLNVAIQLLRRAETMRASGRIFNGEQLLSPGSCIVVAALEK